MKKELISTENFTASDYPEFQIGDEIVAWNGTTGKIIGINGSLLKFIKKRYNKKILSKPNNN